MPFALFVPLKFSSSHSAPNLRLTCLFKAVLLAIFFDSASGVEEFLFTGKERVAVRANFHVDIAGRRPSFDHISARTRNRRRLIFWMNSCFHRFLSIGDFYNIMGKLLQLGLKPGQIDDRMNHLNKRIAKITLTQ